MSAGAGDETQKKPRGFAAMTPERRAELARLGGKAVQASGKAHRFTREEARAASAAAHAGGRSHRFSSEEARAAARAGHEKRRESSESPPSTPSSTPAEESTP